MSLRTWLVALGAGLALLAGTPGGGGPAPGGLPSAQAGKGKEGGPLKFEVYQDKAKEYRWRLKAANGKILATAGQGYKAKADCVHGIERIQADVASDKLKFEVYE